jgi:hypothetical protein
MLKKKILILAPAVTLFLLLAPLPSQAVSTVTPLFPTDIHASLLDKLTPWLDFLADGAKAKKPRAPRAPARHAVSLPEKHGCGIDPQGQPYCTP